MRKDYAALLLVIALGAMGCSRTVQRGGDDGGDDGGVPDGGGDSGGEGPDGGQEDGGLPYKWAVDIGVGLFGSPSLCDLEDDGNPEVIVSSNPNVTNDTSASRTLAIDAESGVVRWKSAKDNGDFASALCVDVNDDDVLDVLVAGRNGDVRALSGTDGKRLWSLDANNPNTFAGNTYAPVVAAGDASVLFGTAGGGGEATTEMPDVPGSVFAFDHDGEILATFPFPNDEETYASLAVWKTDDQRWFVAAGSGGERKGGSLYLLEYDGVAQEFAEVWSTPSACDTGGFVSSPIATDVDGSGDLVVVGVDFCGTVHAVDLAGDVLWTSTSDVLYGTANPLAAELDGTPGYEIVAAFESINFSFAAETSDNPHSQVLAVDGNGNRLWTRDVTDHVFASPIALDLGDNGLEEVLILTFGIGNGDLRVLGANDGADEFTHSTGSAVGTPIATDIDDDGLLDLWILDGLRDLPIRVQRVELPELQGTPAESGFRGLDTHDGVRR